MKFLQKCKNGGGFTLAELLIVMAVVVVLAAATIPTITGQTEAAKQGNDLAALRDAYVQAYAEMAVKKAGYTGDFSGGESTSIPITFQQKADTTNGSFSLLGKPMIANFDLVTNKTSVTGIDTTAKSVKFTFDSDLKITAITGSAS